MEEIKTSIEFLFYNEEVENLLNDEHVNKSVFYAVERITGVHPTEINKFAIVLPSKN